jgi:uncharacterized protein
MELHRGPALYTVQVGIAEQGRSALDDAAAFLIAWLGQGKAYTILAFLFGYGAQLMARRALAAGVPFVALFRRRLLALLAVGLLHTVLLFWGDVLVLYAVCGSALLLAVRASDLTLLAWAAGLLLALVLILTSAAFTISPLTSAEEADQIASAREATASYRGDLGTTIAQHLRDAGRATSGFLFAIPQTIGVFVLGLVAARHRGLEDRARHERTWRRIAVAGLAVGLPLNLASAIAFANGGPSGGAAFGLATLAFTTGPLVLAAGYLALGALVAPRLRVLAPLGRLSLTAYLAQSAVVAVIFTSYGFERYGDVGAAAGLGLTLVIFAAEVAAAHLWLRRHTTGPAERLLRVATYRRSFSPK